jgi:hypothetical protein
VQYELTAAGIIENGGSGFNPVDYMQPSDDGESFEFCSNGVLSAT